ncbi:hypothetical protein TTRE_0000318401 [Trichuris trichiura]|uniref:Uncharacterized protein n=1 Tax=Trichuris trichiura TaxID=36087 RepID=A0A077Z4Y3_TRITR|nr:hypothetical protein TTRE_0000318401 [Trichuris trichiura]
MASTSKRQARTRLESAPGELLVALWQWVSAKTMTDVTERPHGGANFKKGPKWCAPPEDDLSSSLSSFNIAQQGGAVTFQTNRRRQGTTNLSDGKNQFETFAILRLAMSTRTFIPDGEKVS